MRTGCVSPIPKALYVSYAAAGASRLSYSWGALRYLA
jgi:hypothetical protein